MGVFLPGNVVAIVFGLAAAAIFGGCWFATSNVAGRRNILALAVLSGAVIFSQYCYFISHDPFPRFGDSVPVQYERGLFTGLNLLLLTSAYSIYGDVDYGTNVIFAVKSLSIGVGITTQMLLYRNDRYWYFAFVAFCTGTLTLVKYLSTRRGKDNYYYGVLAIGSACALAKAIALLFGPENIAGLPDWIQFAIDMVTDMILFIGLYAMMILTIGGDSSFMADAKRRAADKMAIQCEKVKKGGGAGR